MWKYKDLIITIFLVFVILIWFLFYWKYVEHVEIVKNQKSFTYKDGQILYEIVKKNSWSKTKFILQSYWEEETPFKRFLLGID